MHAEPINLNLAMIVHRLLTSTRGWRVKDLMAQLHIADRTYRKYRQILQEEFSPFRRGDGSSTVKEIGEGDQKYLRLVESDLTNHTDDDFVARVAALNLAQQWLGFMRETEVGQAMESLVDEFYHSIQDKPFVLRHLLRNVDRLFYVVPDAPMDYSSKGTVVHSLLNALIHSRRLQVKYDSTLEGSMDLTLDPLSLVSYRSGLYLLASGTPQADIRVYAVDRFEIASILDDRFDYPSLNTFHPRQFLEPSFGIFHGDSGTPISVELVFKDIRWLKIYLEERRWHCTQRFEDLPDGRLKLTFRVSSMVEVWPWIRGFGDDVEVINPPGPIPRTVTETL